jgi:hypothetical protein
VRECLSQCIRTATDPIQKICHEDSVNQIVSVTENLASNRMQLSKAAHDQAQEQLRLIGNLNRQCQQLEDSSISDCDQYCSRGRNAQLPSYSVRQDEIRETFAQAEAARKAWSREAPSGGL